MPILRSLITWISLLLPPAIVAACAQILFKLRFPMTFLVLAIALVIWGEMRRVLRDRF